MRKARGAFGSPTAVLANDNLGGVRFFGHDGSAFVLGALVQAKATVNWSGTDRGNELQFHTILAGATGTSIRWRISDAGYWIAQTDNTYDIGASGANRPRDIRLARDIIIGGALDHDGTTIGFFGVTPAARASAYTITNVTTDRAYDANATTLDELADIVGTLIADLKTYGLLQ